jgi:transcriptional regulator with XRE-family HTH domain
MELRHFLMAGKRFFRREWLRRVRQALGIPLEEVARKLGVNARPGEGHDHPPFRDKTAEE